MGDGKCECCNRQKELVGVASIPALPMSIAWCKECLDNSAIPLFAADYLFQDVRGDLNQIVPSYLDDQTVFKDGKYIVVREAMKNMVVDPDFFKDNPRFAP
jgi:hypothetical protein